MDTSTPTHTAPNSPTSSSITLRHLPVLESLSLDEPPPPPRVPTSSPTALQHDATDHTPTSESAPVFARSHSTYTRHIGDFPPEIISLIIHHLWYSLVPLPTPFPDLDPYLHLVPATPYSAPRFEDSPGAQAKETLSALALVDKTWGAEATRALWRKVSFGMPRAFESVLRTIEEYGGKRAVERPSRIDARQTLESSLGLSLGALGREGGGLGWEMQAPAVGGAADEERSRAMDLGPNEEDRWGAMAGSGSADGAMVDDGQRREHEAPLPVSLPSLDPADSPLLHTKTINFSRFRTAGMKRTIRQSSNERFVTSHRLLTLMRGTRLGKRKLDYPVPKDSEDEEDEEEELMNSSADELEGAGGRKKHASKGKLESVGFTEYMDSSITLEVLEELLFRGGYLAEYEEPDEPFNPGDLTDFASSSESDLGALPSPSPFRDLALSPVEPFHYRHLQSSHSRSPIDGRTRSSSISSSSIAEEDETMMHASDEEAEPVYPVDPSPDYDSDGDGGEGARTPMGRRPSRPANLQRRASGSAFAPPPTGYRSDDDDTDAEEERGRERFGRRRIPTTSAFRARQRFERSLGPSPFNNSRASSVPAPYHSPQLQTRSLSIAPSERSSSVPASVDSRHGRWPPVPKRVVQVLEGSLAVRPIRALDLCGCISRVFVAAMDDLVKTYKLGPPALLNANDAGGSPLEEDEEDDAMDFGRRTPSVRSMRMGLVEDRVLNRTFFPHLRRLGLASSLLPSNLLTAFVLSFPYLTHLDLASTLTSPILLKGLALAGQNGIGGRKMRLKALSLARCRLVTGPAILGLFCGDCPPLTTMAGISDDDQESWGSGEVVSELTDLSLFGDGTYPSPLERPELRLILTVSPAFTSGKLRTVDLSSTPMNDQLLTEFFPPQPNLLELGLASCRQITMSAVATFLAARAPSVEVLDLSNSCPSNVGQAISSRRRTTIGQPTISVMELHAVLLSNCASLEVASTNPEEAQLLLALRATNLRVVELDEKSLELVQGGAGDWKPIFGKGRRGWYVDTATTSRVSTNPSYPRPRELVHLPRDHPRRLALQRLVQQHGSVTFEVGWHARKMEVLRGDGLMGREDGLFAFHAFG
ncbi:hypothetical protein JCM5296_003984 [Sporobolomyces johnsonii]